MEFLDTAPHQVELSHLSPAPDRAVFAALKDINHAKGWLGGIVSQVAATSPPPYGVGTTREVYFYRGLVKFEQVFIGWEEPHLWCFSAERMRPKVFSKVVEQVRIEPQDGGGCLITYRFGADFTPPCRPLAGAVATWAKYAISPALRRLSDYATGC
ncbi:SRPBCC family protein [Amycolatopsis sp. NPDC088138]|uniref:SRPBCC family protein n=1 Tax=Amycolatopsis sp. NPDC088138 TaxID=3363938 RepID=UPI00382B1114